MYYYLPPKHWFLSSHYRFVQSSALVRVAQLGRRLRRLRVCCVCSLPRMAARAPPRRALERPLARGSPRAGCTLWNCCPWYCSTTSLPRVPFQQICKQKQTSSRKDSFSHAILYSALLFLRLFEKAISTQNMYISTIYIFHTLNLNVFLYLQLRIFVQADTK